LISIKDFFWVGLSNNNKDVGSFFDKSGVDLGNQQLAIRLNCDYFRFLGKDNDCIGFYLDYSKGECYVTWNHQMTNVSGKFDSTKIYYPIIYTFFKNTGFTIKYDAKIPSFDDIIEANRIQVNFSKSTTTNDQKPEKKLIMQLFVLVDIKLQTMNMAIYIQKMQIMMFQLGKLKKTMYKMWFSRFSCYCRME